METAIGYYESCEEGKLVIRKIREVFTPTNFSYGIELSTDSDNWYIKFVTSENSMEYGDEISKESFDFYTSQLYQSISELLKVGVPHEVTGGGLLCYQTFSRDPCKIKILYIAKEGESLFFGFDSVLPSFRDRESPSIIRGKIKDKVEKIYRYLSEE